MSVPEEFLLAFFAWTILGKKDSVKFRNVIATALITAIAFASIQVLSNSNITLMAIFNLVIFTVIIFFTYNLSLFESLVSSLLTIVIGTLIQAVTANVGLIITSFSLDDIESSRKLKLMFFIPYLVFFAVLSLVIYKLNIKVLNFKKKKSSIYYFSRIRFIVLQLTFTLLIIILNFRLYWSNKKLFDSPNDKVLIIMNFAFVVFFTILIVISVFKMGKSIQAEEERKRAYDGREIFQNIDYLCKLMEMKEYSEVEKMLEYIKSDVDTDIINKSRTNRDSSIK
ncbi:MAG: hypothetical protein Q8942_06715 [Bacillota bacterium]|nr:hypothetical protein [Bacillota bacterium]